MTDLPDVAYKILSRADWRATLAEGRYDGSAVDLADGYIHFSTAAQVEETAARHFTAQPGLLLVAVDTAVLGAALRWEPSRGGALFPHLYQPLGLDAVRWAVPLPVGPDGRHRFPVLA